MDWINISRRTPTKDGIYIVTTKTFDPTDTDHTGRYKREVFTTEWDVFRRAFQVSDMQEVIAWMPLPGAYNENEVSQEKIWITCYGQKEGWTSRQKALAFYRECIEASEGSERDRYVRIYLQLEEGNTECSDEDE